MPLFKTESKCEIIEMITKHITKDVIQLPVCFTRIERNTLRSREKECLKRLPCQISAIK